MAMYDEISMTPKLRFPEFAREPLRQFYLGDVTEDCTGRNGKGVTSVPIMGVSKTDGIVPMEGRLIGKDTARYKCLKTNWFAYNPMRLNIGSIARWKGDGDVLVSPDYVVFRCVTEREPSIDPNYLDQFRCSAQWERFVGGSGDGGVRIRIYYKDLAQLPIALPSPAEQRKIAECLESLDNWIRTESLKLSTLQSYRNGLMQQLFPQEGESRPRLRFPEFRKAAEWKERTLEEIASISSGSTPRRDNSEFFDGGTIPWVKTTDLNNSVILSTEECITEKAKATISPAGSILIAMYGGFKQIGRTGLLKFPAATNQALSVLRLSGKDVIPIYAQAWLNAKVEYWKRIASSSRKDPNITGSDVARFPIQFPLPAEQQRIATCLSSLDTVLAAQSEKVVGLKVHKKCLMQQLFPAAEE